VKGIESHTSPDEGRDLSETRPRDGTESIPETAVMYNQELASLLQSGPDRLLAGIHGDPEATKITRPGHLQAIEGMGIIWKTGNFEGLVKKMED
jgi:hypothetical protein